MTKILNKQKLESWSSRAIENISNNLRKKLPEMKGVSTRNLVFIQAFSGAYQEDLIMQQSAEQITKYI